MGPVQRPPAGRAVPVAEGDLLEPAVPLDRLVVDPEMLGDDRGRLPGPAERARHQPEPVAVQESGEGAADGVDLDEAEAGERRVELALQPSGAVPGGLRSEEHTSELQSLMRISYAVFC